MKKTKPKNKPFKSFRKSLSIGFKELAKGAGYALRH